MAGTELMSSNSEQVANGVAAIPAGLEQDRR